MISGKAPQKRQVTSKANSKGSQERDAKKEKSIQLLISILQDAGISVRREKLKKGPHWNAQSGICGVRDTAGGDNVGGFGTIVFIDRAATQDDQIDFLANTVRQLSLELDSSILSALPGPIQKMISAVSLAQVA